MNTLTLEQRLIALENRVAVLEAENKILRQENIALKERVIELERENISLKQELKDLWDYVIKLNKHFENCWNALRGMLGGKPGARAKALKTYGETNKQAPEIIDNIKED